MRSGSLPHPHHRSPPSLQNSARGGAPCAARCTASRSFLGSFVGHQDIMTQTAAQPVGNSRRKLQTGTGKRHTLLLAGLWKNFSRTPLIRCCIGTRHTSPTLSKSYMLSATLNNPPTACARAQGITRLLTSDSALRQRRRLYLSASVLCADIVYMFCNRRLALPCPLGARRVCLFLAHQSQVGRASVGVAVVLARGNGRTDR